MTRRSAQIGVKRHRPLALLRNWAGFDHRDVLAGDYIAGAQPELWSADLQREISQIVTAPEMKESLLEQGSIAVGSPPEELNAVIRSEYALWSRVVKAGNVKVE